MKDNKNKTATSKSTFAIIGFVFGVLTVIALILIKC